MIIILFRGREINAQQDRGGVTNSAAGHGPYDSFRSRRRAARLFFSQALGRKFSLQPILPAAFRNGPFSRICTPRCHVDILPAACLMDCHCGAEPLFCNTPEGWNWLMRYF